MSRELPVLAFVRVLASGGEAVREGDRFVLADGRFAKRELVRRLVSAGALAGDATRCRANRDTRGWLKRAMIDEDAFRAQHGDIRPTPDGGRIDLGESPLARLAAGEAAFLASYQVEAGERVRRLVERAGLLPRLTMSYSAAHRAGDGQGLAGDISDLAAEARREVAQIHRVLPADCAGVVLDVCGLLKGLQEVERDRGWPRRSAKLVLRIGLDQLARHYGLAPLAVGAVRRGARAWMEDGARPTRFG